MEHLWKRDVPPPLELQRGLNLWIYAEAHWSSSGCSCQSGTFLRLCSTLLLWSIENKDTDQWVSSLCRWWSWRGRFCPWCTASAWRTGSGCWSEPAASPSRTPTLMRSNTSSAPTPMSSKFFTHTHKMSSLTDNNQTDESSRGSL